MLLTLSLLAAVTPPCAPDRLERVERRIPGGDPGVELFMMEVRTPVKPRRGAVVLAHGAGSGGSAIWDLRHADYSTMRALACAGFDTYAVDYRGFGGSSMPKALSEADAANPPAVRAADAVKDLRQAVLHAAARSGVERVDLVAWSWGSVVSGLFAGEHPERVRRLVLLAPVFDRRWPNRHRTKGAWRPAVKADIVKYFDETREAWPVWIEHLDAMFRFSKDGTLRLPNGPYRDIYGEDAPMWSPEKIRAPTLVIRGSEDRASLDEHAQRLFERLTKAPERRYVVIGGAQHFLPRERRYRQFQGAVIDFLTLEPLTAPIEGRPEGKR